MIKVFLDQIKDVETIYIEDMFSAYEIVSMDIEVFIEVLKERYGREVHTCYAECVCHIGRFHREHGENWAGEEVAIFAKREFDKDYERFYFNEKGQLQEWHYGFFG